MPLFLSDEEFERCSHDVSLVADKADSFIKDLYTQLETFKAQADASSITAEQTCALLEQKYISLSSDFEKLESQNAQLNASLEQHLSELAQVQSEKHQLHLKSIGKDEEVERLSIETSELHKSKRQLLELVQQKDIEISEKNATVKSYLDRIVILTDNGALREARLHDIEAEAARSNAALARLSQEKELIERHNVWLNDELNAKVGSLIELRRSHTELEADMSANLANVQREFNECSRSLKWHKERVQEVEIKLTSMQEELCSSKDSAAANEERFSTEISMVTKLVELYKETSEEWSKKAGELEGVIKALETHLNQVENDYKEKLEKEISVRKESEKAVTNLKEKLEKCEAEIENHRKANELSLLPLSSFREERLICGNEVDEINEENRMIIPKIPAGVSGTALAASLLRDGWSLGKMYEKYHEAVDALRHERLGRKQSEAILERVLFEIEEKAEVILDERAEHERMAEAYSLMNEKLQQSLSEQVNLESTIEELKADLRRHEREYGLTKKEIVDLQKQVTVLLKECRDVQLRCGSTSHTLTDECAATTALELSNESDIERVISERLLTFKDINGLVEQNVQLRSIVRSLSVQNESRDAELKERFEMELRKKTDEATLKVAAVLERSQEQARMIESLHSSVAMYKRLYEEELKLHGFHSHSGGATPDNGRKDIMLLLEGSQEATKKAHERATEQAKHLEEELSKSRSEIISIRLERDKLAMEATFARERLDSFMKEVEHQRDEVNGVLARNVEFSQLIVDYQRKLRESSDSLHASDELARKLTMELSILKHEKEMLLNSEKRACDEVCRLSERANRLQASLDTIQSAEEIREDARAMDRRKQDEYLKKVEREWAEAKEELQVERDNFRKLTLDRDDKIKNAMTQEEERRKELADAWRAVAAAEARAAVAESRLSDLEANFNSSKDKALGLDCVYDPSTCASNEVAVDLVKAKEELARLKEEAHANHDHMLQYKNIAQVNEAALKQMESVHEKFKAEADKLKKLLEAEIISLKERVFELENSCISKSEEAASSIAGKEEALHAALAEITNLKEESSERASKVMGMEIQISSLREDLEKENQRWRMAQNNYERQVILQSETIQELTKTSQALASLQQEASELRKLADATKSENEILKATLETKKSELEKFRNESERKYSEINEQNKILHDHLEALHIKFAERERNYAGISSGCTGSDQHGNADKPDMQNVVQYLRRSKEIAETEISLLKQEKLRLQSQLDRALKASETAQSLLHSERANSRGLLFTDEEFRSLQIQVSEINLLRESNKQLREENKHNFEECLKLREIAQKARTEIEHLETLVREKQSAVDACQKEVNMQMVEKKNLESRIVELLGQCKNISLEDYERMKDDTQQMQVKMREKEAEVEETKKLVFQKQDRISSLEQELANTNLEIVEREKKINEAAQAQQDNLRSDFEKQRRSLGSFYKKKFETLTKEKEDLSEKKSSLLKQLEDSKQGKRSVGDSSNDQAVKEKDMEKDTRIQMLEKTVERERDVLRIEKNKRIKSEKAIMETLSNVNKERKKVLDELELAKARLAESGGTLTAELQNALAEQTASYLSAVDKLEVEANAFANDGSGAPSAAAETSSLADTPSMEITARQVPPQIIASPPTTAITVGSLLAKATDGKEKRPNLPKSNVDTRKVNRKLNRPRLGRREESTGDIEMSEPDLPSNTEVKMGSSQESESQSAVSLLPQISARKRLASLSAFDASEEIEVQLEAGTSSTAHVPKKSRGFDSSIKTAEGQPAVLPEVPEALPPVEESNDAPSNLPVPCAANEETDDAEKDEIDTSTINDPAEEPKDTSSGRTNHIEVQNESRAVSEELVENARDTEEDTDEGMRDGEEQDPQHSTAEDEDEREEGELMPDFTAEREGGSISILTINTDQVEGVTEPGTVSDTPPAGIEEEALAEVTEAKSPEISNDEKNGIVEELMEEVADDSDKSTGGNDQGGGDTEQSPQGAGENSSPSNLAELPVSKQGSLTALPEIDEGREVPPQPVINLTERARQKAVLRQAGVVPQPAVVPQSAVVSQPAAVVSPPNTRARGRSTAPFKRGARGLRGGLGPRGARGGRGQSSDDKGQT